MYEFDEGGFPSLCFFIYIFTEHSGHKNVYIWSVILTKQAAKINIYKKIDKRDEGALNPVYIPYHSL